MQCDKKLPRLIGQRSNADQSNKSGRGACPRSGLESNAIRSSDRHASLFVGDWVAPLLLFGVYNKIVKTQGSDRSH
jgi:hypothetical protein